MRTIQQVIDLIIASVPGAPFDDTVDTFKCGDPTQEVTGIVTTFTASIDVLREAVKSGANLIITHEPTFYEHREQSDWIEGDSVLQAKRAFLAEHGLTVWRFHDSWHRHQPDGIITGMLKALGWETYQPHESWSPMVIPGMTLAKLVSTFKEMLGLPTVRVMGDPDQACERIALLVGAPGGEWQILAFQQWNVDVVICGETSEWQTCEYVRDAIALGQKKALVIVGHAKSEEEGMRYLSEWLQPKVPEIPITYLAVGDPIVML